VGHLDLLKEVDAHVVLVPLAGKVDLDEVAHDAKFDNLTEFAPLVHGSNRIGGAGRPAAGDEVLTPDAASHLGKGEGVESAAHVAAGVAIGEAADKELVKCGSGDHTELTELRYGLRETPVGDADAHSALNDFGKLHHLWIVSHSWINPRLFFDLREFSRAKRQAVSTKWRFSRESATESGSQGGAATMEETLV
jgi:hypothetical protein